MTDYTNKQVMKKVVRKQKMQEYLLLVKIKKEPRLHIL